MSEPDASVDEYPEYGYRLSDGTESWETDHGTDGSWTSWDEERGIDAIDMYPGSEVKSIYEALSKAGIEGVAIRRLVTLTRGPVEEVPPQ